MKSLIWYQWLYAQKHWSALYKAGYRAHTPESVFLVWARDLENGVLWTNPWRTDRRSQHG